MLRLPALGFYGLTLGGMYLGQRFQPFTMLRERAGSNLITDTLNGEGAAGMALTVALAGTIAAMAVDEGIPLIPGAIEIPGLGSDKIANVSTFY
jgi:hypothetical protein